MADKVEFGGKSKYEVAYHMAQDVLRMENTAKSITRDAYLKLIHECIEILDGVNPSKPNGF